MPDRLLLNAPALEPPAQSTAARLPAHHDEGLLLNAAHRWRESCEALHQLFADVPTARDTLLRVLKQQLNLEQTGAGLLFAAQDPRPERFIPMVQVCAFVFQQPLAKIAVEASCRVTGLSTAHALFGLTPAQLLARLKTLPIEQALQTRWNTYWDARTPGSPVSRRERASQLYREHLDATAQLAFAQRSLTAEQLLALATLQEASAATPAITTEQLSLVLSNGSKVKLPAAWVISFGTEAPVSQWLYLPLRPEAFQVFAQRQDLESWLSTQSLVPTGLPHTDLHFEYTGRNLPLTAGMTDLLAHLYKAQFDALRNGSVGKANLYEQASQALDNVDQTDHQRNTGAVFAFPPTLDNVVVEPEQQALFGSLYADIPWPLRQAALNRQRDALETLLDGADTNTALQPFKQTHETLEAAEQAADKAATALLGRPRALDLATFNREFTALHQAHKSGLQAEADLQGLLSQLSETERDRIKALLETPQNPGAEHVAASLVLSSHEQGADNPAPAELNGPFVMTHPQALLDRESPHSVLLYWPGNGGGLQRFANRRVLEQQVFKIAGQDAALALQLKKISGDPLQHGLSQLTSDFDEQAGLLRSRFADASTKNQYDEQLAALRQRSLGALQVPVNAARSLAFTQVLEQANSGTLADVLPDWLARLSTADRSALKQLIEAFLLAMQRSHEQLTLALQPRDDFTRTHLHERLRKDFALKGSFEITLDLPDSVKMVKRYKPAPGHSGYELVPEPSATRSKMPLVELAQLNIDNTPSMQLEPLSLRLTYMRVEVSASDAVEAETLKKGLTLTWLKRVLPELDLPLAYEKRIREAFTGAPDESTFVREHRRECLVESWRAMLKLQGEFARLQNHISQDELQILSIATDANTAQAWQAERKRIVIRPAYLSVGGADTPNEGAVTLSGVTFIEEQVSGITLLYLPDSPDDRFLRRYDNLESARMALYKMCMQDSWIRYLAGRALQGNVRAHESRLNEAVLKHFDAIIGVGERWPPGTSFATHLLDAHMGRLIEAHRGTSRSNDALYMERYALKGPRAFNYLKMAIGLLPFIGTAIAVYDAWTAANQSVAAFLRGDIGEGLAELESVLLSLIDAAMDLLPGELAFSAVSRAARSVTRARQMRVLLRTTAALQNTSRRQARHLAARFSGYEYEKPISLAGLQPGTDGLYRGIYRHADGDFIVRQGRIFEVQRSNDSRNWRLRGTRKATYKQPVALNDNGEWDTWFGVYGSTFEGGGLGGGNVIGHLADTLDPIWPQAIRQRLPRWWVDRNFRRHHLLTALADDLSEQLEIRGGNSDVTLNRYASAKTDEARQALIPAAEAAAIGDIEIAIRRYQTLLELEPLTHGNKRRALIEMQSGTAAVLTDRYARRAIHNSHSTSPLITRIEALNKQLDELPQDALVQRLTLMEERRQLRLEYLRKLDQMEVLRVDVNHWYERIRIAADKKVVASLVDDLNAKHSTFLLSFQKTYQRLEAVQRAGSIGDASWLYLLGQARRLREKVARALNTHHDLLSANVTRVQRDAILQDCVDTYAQFAREMKVWTASYPQYFHEELIEPLMSGFEKLGEQARKSISNPVHAAPPAGEINRKVFPTEDDQWLIGVEKWDKKNNKHQYEMHSGEIWEQTASGKYRLSSPAAATPAPPPLSLSTLVAEARKRLDSQAAYRARVDSYADQDMLPVDLEHMLVSEAAELNLRADRIANIAPQNPVITQLRNKATELIASGRALRTRQSLTTKSPTDGMLLDLIEQHAVEIRKVQPLKNISKRGARKDYLQEYEIWDLTLIPSELLWYAHFHYTRATPVMRVFEKAHLKLPEHRFSTRADDPDLPTADIGRQSAVLEYFEAL
ncbi:hypothetical protein JFT86_12845 [Pseudomonas sp. TH06]|uniref:dermonecrotic toxin domain-containing protein n=1 Tax=Pseudomonas sp. TH06 TaxID=2796372 RepID=UPI0019138711|nr:DUF6543 domain-containing protein [Pseudomonas sp. TH06]MBK5527828.1 hypothetical protein [Pseudomonas sp. TH06]